VNGKMVPLRNRLMNGDTVEVITSPAQYPRKDWLEFVVSGRARGRIRHSIRASEREKSRELGREILDRELRKRGMSLARLLEGKDLVELAAKEVHGSTEVLFGALGYGRVNAVDIVRKLRGEEVVDPEPERKPTRLRGLFRRQAKSSSSGIRVSGQSDVLVRFGRCCAPLPGDEVIGFVTRGRGVTVHVKDCVKVYELDPARRIEVDWDSDTAMAHRIKMRVRSIDQPGLLAKITKAISAAGVNIGAARVSTTSDQKSLQTFDLLVTDVGTLNAVMKQIGKIKGVISVDRLRN
jgi:GTP pyrophosphokinase